MSDLLSLPNELLLKILWNIDRLSDIVSILEVARNLQEDEDRFVNVIAHILGKKGKVVITKDLDDYKCQSVANYLENFDVGEAILDWEGSTIDDAWLEQTVSLANVYLPQVANFNLRNGAIKNDDWPYSEKGCGRAETLTIGQDVTIPDVESAVAILHPLSVSDLHVTHVGKEWMMSVCDFDAMRWFLQYLNYDQFKSFSFDVPLDKTIDMDFYLREMQKISEEVHRFIDSPMFYSYAMSVELEKRRVTFKFVRTHKHPGLL